MKTTTTLTVAVALTAGVLAVGAAPAANAASTRPAGTVTTQVAARQKPAPQPGAALLGSYAFTATPAGHTPVTGLLQLSFVPVETFAGVAAGYLFIDPKAYQAFQGLSDTELAFLESRFLNAQGQFAVQTSVQQANDGSLSLVFGTPQLGSLSGGAGAATGAFTPSTGGGYSGSYTTTTGVTGTTTETLISSAH